MKKVLFLLSVVSASILTGCDNENSVNPQPLGTAKITGTVTAEFDYTNNDPEVVANKKFVASIRSSGGSVQYIEGTTDANGNYAIDVTIGNRALEVSVWLVDFKQVVKYNGSQEEEIFYGQAFFNSVEVVKGGEYILDLSNNI